MTPDYDVILIGAGPAGEHCAAALAEGGLRVAIVERELVAGECSYYACIPSKTLLRPGEARTRALEVPGTRESVCAPLDAAEALAWRDFMVSEYDDSAQAKWLADNGIDLFRGSGRITAPGTVAVRGRALRCEHIVIATGSEPFIPPIPGLRELDGVWTNREVTGVRSIPKSMVILGAGPVGVEMAQAFTSFGSRVELVEGMGQVLPREPAPLGAALGERLAAAGIGLHLNTRAVGVTWSNGEFSLATEDGPELHAERLLVATGRRPRVHDIGLDALGIKPDAHGVPVDDRMNAGDGVWAIGDVTGVWPLTYVGKYQGRVAAANILGEARRANYEAVPRVVFTDPQAAAVGAAEGPVEVTVPLADVPKTATYTRSYAEQNGFLTLISDGELVTGAYALGPEAGEWMQQATLAIRAGIPIEVMYDTIQPFPTFSEIFYFALAKLTSGVASAVA